MTTRSSGLPRPTAGATKGLVHDSNSSRLPSAPGTKPSPPSTPTGSSAHTPSRIAFGRQVATSQGNLASSKGPLGNSQPPGGAAPVASRWGSQGASAGTAPSTPTSVSSSGSATSAASSDSTATSQAALTAPQESGPAAGAPKAQIVPEVALEQGGSSSDDNTSAFLTSGQCKESAASVPAPTSASNNGSATEGEPGGADISVEQLVAQAFPDLARDSAFVARVQSVMQQPTLLALPHAQRQALFELVASVSSALRAAHAPAKKTKPPSRALPLLRGAATVLGVLLSCLALLGTAYTLLLVLEAGVVPL